MEQAAESTAIEIPMSDTEDPKARMGECRICMDDDKIENLIAPCDCQGSVQYVHTECLRKWCRERGSTRCEICHSEYEIDGLDEEARGAILDAVQASQAEQAVERERLRQLRQSRDQYRFPHHGRDWLTLQNFEGDGLHDVEETEERVAQVRRLIVFAVLVTITMLLFHLIGSLLLSHAVEADGLHSATDTLHPATSDPTASGSAAGSGMAVGSGTGSGAGHDYRGHDKEAFSPAVSRVIRVLIFFYIIRSLVVRPPEYAEHRRGRSLDLL